MKIQTLAIFSLASVNIYAAMTADGESALRNGALGRYVYRVVDDGGIPVSNASAHVWFRSYGRPQDKADWVVQTDTNGMFAAEHRFNEQFSVGIDKEGYYHTHVEINYLSMTELPVKDGKWQPYGETRTVVLKRIRNLGKLSVPNMGHFAVGERKIPKFDCWLPFDLEKFDWNAPYGTGTHPDVLLRFRNRTTPFFYDYTDRMDVCFTNNLFAGVYEVKKDNVSDMVMDYAAQTNAVYKNYFTFTCERTADNKRTEIYLRDDSYFVFRTRTTIDENGGLKTAHYGLILGAWMSGGGYMRITDGCFNRAENDCNIEDSYYLRNKVKHYSDIAKRRGSLNEK